LTPRSRADTKSLQFQIVPPSYEEVKEDAYTMDTFGSRENRDRQGTIDRRNTIDNSRPSKQQIDYIEYQEPVRKRMASTVSGTSMKSRGSSKSRNSRKHTRSCKSTGKFADSRNHSSKSVKRRVKSKQIPIGLGKSNSDMFLVINTSTPTIKSVKKPPKMIISKGKVLKREDEVPLVEKLLAEIMSKYNPRFIDDSAYMSRFEKKSMVKEIRILSKALIKSEKTHLKITEKYNAHVRKWKEEKQETDFKLQSALRRQTKLEAENDALLRKAKDFEDKLFEKTKEVKFTYQKFDSAREQHSNEMRELLLRIEREKQDYFEKEHGKF
jgi:hypothetical protein